MKTAYCNYGPLLKGQQYRIVSQGYDWYGVTINGKMLTVPKYVFVYAKLEEEEFKPITKKGFFDED